MRIMFTIIALFALACAGEPFTGFDNEIKVSAVSGMVEPMLPVQPSEAGMGGSSDSGTSGRRATNQGGELPEPISGGAAGAGGAMVDIDPIIAGSPNGGAAPIVSTWLCRTDGDLCQCYSDPSLFEPGWLNVASCPASTRCASRDASACVCWDTEAAYTSALMNGFVKEEGCPNVQNDG